MSGHSLETRSFFGDTRSHVLLKECFIEKPGLLLSRAACNVDVNRRRCPLARLRCVHHLLFSSVPLPQLMLVPGQEGALRLGVHDALKRTTVPDANERVHVVVAASYTASAVGAPSGRSRIGSRLEIGAEPAACQPPAAM